MGLRPTVRPRLRLLYIGDAELARQCLGRPGGSIEVFEADPNAVANDSALPFDILLIEHGHAGADALAILRNLGSRATSVPVVVVAEWDEELAVKTLELGASDYVTKSRASFRAIYFRLHRLRAHAALLAGQTREGNGKSDDEIIQQLEAHRAARAEAEERLGQAIVAIKQAREGRFADAVAAAKELAHRESVFGTKLQQAEAAIRSLERSLADRDAAIREIDMRGSAERAASHAADLRQYELETRLAAEAERCREVQARLDEATDALRATEQQRVDDAAAFADRIARHESDATAAAERVVRQRYAMEERLDATIAALEQARAERVADADAAARHLTARESIVAAEISDAAARQDQLERRLTNTETALRCAEQRVTAERLAGQQRIAEQHAEFEAELARHVAIRETQRQQIGDARKRLEQAEASRTADDHRASAQLADLQAQHAAQLADAAQLRDQLESRLASLEAAAHQASERHAADLREAASRFAEHHAQYAGRLSEAAQDQHALRTQLESAVAALHEAEQRHGREMGAAAARFAEQEAQQTARLSEAEQSQHALRTQLATIEAELENANERHAADMSEMAARAAESRDAADARLAQAGAAILVLENKLAESESAKQRADDAHASAMADAAKRLADHQEETATWLAEAAVSANKLQDDLAGSIEAFHRLELQAAIDRDAATDASRRQQAAFDARLGEADTTRQALMAQLKAGEIAFQDARDRHARETKEAAARLADVHEKYEVRLTQADTAIKVAESKRAEALASLDRVARQSTAERQAANEESRQRQAKFDASFRQEAERRQQVEKDLYHTRMAFEEARLQFVNDLAAATERGIQNEARLEAQAAEDRAAWDRARETAEAEIQHLQKEGDRLHQSLVAAVREIRRGETAQHHEREQSERTRIEIEGELAREREQATALQRALDQTRSAARETLERATDSAAKDRSRLEGLIADREAELHEQLRRAQSSDAAAAAALADVEQRLNVSLVARDRDREAIARLETRLEATNQELESTKQQRETLRFTAGQIPVLQDQIDVIHAMNRREFEDSPVSRFRCSRTGEITAMNGALVRTLGYDSIGRLQAVDFRQAVFESADELQWLVDRCVASRVGESIDTTWRKQDGTRIIVRVVAVATGEDAIDLVVEDMTPRRVLEEKLRHAQRMEAVARYGSEVAVTCHTLLAHVKQEGEQWLARMESDVARYQGQLLFDDVAKAEGYLRQLAVYGEEQRNAPEVVEMNTVLRDLAPVLKRVAGDNIDIVLPETTTPLPLDVEARPVERMLVNVAAYGRERMPRGGRLMIDVDSVVVDRAFVEKHPNVRPGAHVVLIVNEVRRPDATALVEAALVDPGSTTRIGGSPGLELGTLQALVSDCGGHLWMKAEPPGDMVLKIHLPRRVLDRSDSPAPAMARVRSGWLQRAFGSRH
jgi:hypothetical protein